MRGAEGIKKATFEHKRKLEDQFASSNIRTVWQGLQQITQYRQSTAAIDNSDPSFPDQLNDLYSIFDKLNTSSEQRPLPAGTPLSPPFTVQEAEVRKLFGRQSTRKASGPDNVSISTLRNCAGQLSTFVTDIYNSSLHQCRVPVYFKTFTIMPIPKNSNISRMNDYRSVALTPVAMKVFERTFLKYPKPATDGLLDPHQFAHQANR